jgi:hypothetical protein
MDSNELHPDFIEAPWAAELVRRIAHAQCVVVSLMAHATLVESDAKLMAKRNRCSQRLKPKCSRVIYHRLTGKQHWGSPALSQIQSLT